MQQARRWIVWIVLFCVLFLGLAVLSAQAEVVFEEAFESGGTSWEIDNGVWEVGIPGSWPERSQCAGTVLDGVYGAYTDSRLISPSLQLPGVSGAEELHLRFWHWFSYSTYDAGYVQISLQDEASGEWSAWENVGDHITGWSGGWVILHVDITAYAGQKVRIAFYHTADRPRYTGTNESSGWYVDGVTVVAKVPDFGGDFEDGWGDWWQTVACGRWGYPARGRSGRNVRARYWTAYMVRTRTAG